MPVSGHKEHKTVKDTSIDFFFFFLLKLPIRLMINDCMELFLKNVFTIYLILGSQWS